MCKESRRALTLTADSSDLATAQQSMGKTELQVNSDLVLGGALHGDASVLQLVPGSVVLVPVLSQKRVSFAHPILSLRACLQVLQRRLIPRLLGDVQCAGGCVTRRGKRKRDRDACCTWVILEKVERQVTGPGKLARCVHWTAPLTLTVREPPNYAQFEVSARSTPA